MDSKIREAMFAAGVEIAEHLTVLDARVENDVATVASEEVDVYGNSYQNLVVRGTKITLVLYSTEV